MRKKAMAQMVALAEEEEEEEPSEEQRDAAVLVGKTELGLVNHGLESFDKGLKLLKAKPESLAAFAQESIRAAQELEEYGVSLDLKVNHGKCTHIYTFTHTFTHTFIHTFVRTCIHMYIHTRARAGFSYNSAAILLVTLSIVCLRFQYPLSIVSLREPE